MGTEKELKCVFCGDLIVNDMGNNAEPVKKGRCCDKCNADVIIPARLKEMKSKLNDEYIIDEDNNEK